MLSELKNAIRQTDEDAYSLSLIVVHRISLALVLSQLQARIVARDLIQVEWCLSPFY